MVLNLCEYQEITTDVRGLFNVENLTRKHFSPFKRRG